MATGRTISASFLTGSDDRVIRLCQSISAATSEAITGVDKQRDFAKQYGKISATRDAGTGVGAGKLQRDALCTRGRQGKAPFSNRNLRWHPLVVAAAPPPFAQEIERIEILGTGDAQTFNFVIKDARGRQRKFPADKVYSMPGKFVALPKHWLPHIEALRHWSDALWTQNSCVIAAQEACDWWDAVETYAVLGIAIAVEFYGADFDQLHGEVVSRLQGQTVNKSVSLPTSAFPATGDDILQCPLCRRRVSTTLADFRKAERGESWQPAWRTSKQNAGDDSSIQLMHVNPLVEREIRHRADNVRYGHRWCNVAMTDHSLDETLDFMEFVVQAHNREGKW